MFYKGFLVVGLNEIFVVVGILKGLFYYYFGLKEVFGEVLFELYFEGYFVYFDNLFKY